MLSTENLNNQSSCRHTGICRVRLVIRAVQYRRWTSTVLFLTKIIVFTVKKLWRFTRINLVLIHTMTVIRFHTSADYHRFIITFIYLPRSTTETFWTCYCCFVVLLMSVNFKPFFRQKFYQLIVFISSSVQWSWEKKRSIL